MRSWYRTSQPPWRSSDYGNSLAEALTILDASPTIAHASESPAIAVRTKGEVEALAGQTEQAVEVAVAAVVAPRNNTPFLHRDNDLSAYRA
tara:strand:+ start:17663 stop:17935 length:273 start_codon:yes stop_codon:yes gene_type:complete